MANHCLTCAEPFWFFSTQDSLEGAVEWLYTEEDSLKTTPMAALVAGKKAEIRRLAQALAI